MRAMAVSTVHSAGGSASGWPAVRAVAGDLLVLSVDATGVAMIERDLREAR